MGQGGEQHPVCGLSLQQYVLLGEEAVVVATAL